MASRKTFRRASELLPRRDRWTSRSLCISESLTRANRWAEAGLKAADRGARLAGQLLAFSRTQKLDIASIDISSVLTGFADMLRRTIGPSIALRMDLHTDRVFAEGDQTQLELAVLNLTLNARDAMPSGGELVIAARPCRLTGDPELQDGDYVELSVKDSGAGLSAEVAERAFEPFFTTKDVGKATGLGLSQVYGTLHQSGGAARIDSGPGAGTTVRLYLRRTEVQPRPAEEHSAEAEGAPAATVLIVDDDPDVRAFLTDSLETLGYSSLVAEDGASALKVLEAAAPAAMILDFAMPSMNGAEVARWARQTRPDLPIIFASGYSETAALTPVQESRHSRMLHKPFKVGELQSALAELLARPDRATATQRHAPASESTR